MSTQPEPMAQGTATAEPSGEVGKNLQEKSSARVQDIEADEDMRGLDIVEQKMILINRVINSQGMGRYQVCYASVYLLPPKCRSSRLSLQLCTVVPVRTLRIWLSPRFGLRSVVRLDYHTLTSRTWCTQRQSR